jgi:hypothetical protein
MLGFWGLVVVGLWCLVLAITPNEFDTNNVAVDTLARIVREQGAATGPQTARIRGQVAELKTELGRVQFDFGRAIVSLEKKLSEQQRLLIDREQVLTVKEGELAKLREELEWTQAETAAVKEEKTELLGRLDTLKEWSNWASGILTGTPVLVGHPTPAPATQPSIVVNGGNNSATAQTCGSQPAPQATSTPVPTTTAAPATKPVTTASLREAPMVNIYIGTSSGLRLDPHFAGEAGAGLKLWADAEETRSRVERLESESVRSKGGRKKRSK